MGKRQKTIDIHLCIEINFDVQLKCYYFFFFECFSLRIRHKYEKQKSNTSSKDNRQYMKNSFVIDRFVFILPNSVL